MKIASLAFLVCTTLASSQQYLVPPHLKNDDYHEVSTDLVIQEAKGKYFFGIKVPLADSTDYTFGVKFDNGRTSFVKGPGCHTPGGKCSLASGDDFPWKFGDVITFGVVQNGDNDLKLLAGIQVNDTAGESFTETINGIGQLTSFEVLQNNVDAENCPGKAKSLFSEIRYVTKDVIRETPRLGDLQLVSDANELECSRNKNNYAIAVDSDGKVILGSGLDGSQDEELTPGKVPINDATSDGDSTGVPSENSHDEPSKPTKSTTTNTQQSEGQNDGMNPVSTHTEDRKPEKPEENSKTPTKADGEGLVYIPSAVTTEIDGKQTTFVTVVKGTTDDSEQGKALKTLAPLYTMFGEW